MSFLSNTAGKRPLVLLCVRLLIQSAMVWSIPQVGIDGLKAFHVLCGAISKSIARQESLAAGFSNALAVLPRTGSRRLPS